MNFLSKLFGNLNLDVNNLVDNLTTTKEEKQELKIKFEALFLEARAKAEEQITRRWESDNKAGWLPANIRPLTLIYLTAIITVLSIFDGNLEIGGKAFTIGEAYVPVYQTLLMTVYAAYFAGRSIEKVKEVAR